MIYCGNGKRRQRERKARAKEELRQWQKVPLGARIKWHLSRIYISIANCLNIDAETGRRKAGFTVNRTPYWYIRPAPERRGRPLTATSSSGGGSKDTDGYLEQKESPLFAKLPFDVRRLIYIAVLGGEMIHFIDWPSQSLPYTACTKAEDRHWTSLQGCWSLGRFRWVCSASQVNEHRTSRYMKRSIGGMALIKPSGWEKLGLPMTCRRIYSESINILYSHNTFNIGEDLNLDHFHAYLPPQRWKAIRSICVTSIDLYPAEVSTQDPEWNKIWLHLSFLTGLHTLRVRVNVLPLALADDANASGPEIWLEMGPTLLCAFEPMRKFNWLREFEIAVEGLGEMELDMLREGYPGAPFRFVQVYDE